MKPEEKETLFQSIRIDILKHWNIDILQKTKRVEVVEARMTFVQIIHEGFDLRTMNTEISQGDVMRFLRVDHSTIIYYLKNFPVYVETSKYDTKEMYDTLYIKYIKHKGICKVYTISSLETKRNMLITQLAEVNEEINNYKRLEYGN